MSLILTGNQAFLRLIITSDGQDPDPTDFTFMGSPEAIFKFVDSFATGKTGRRVAGVTPRENKRFLDIDFVPTAKEQNLKITAEAIFQDSVTAQFMDAVKADPRSKVVRMFNTDFLLPSPEGLYALLMTQRFHGRTFRLVKKEIKALRSLNVQLTPLYQPFFDAVVAAGFDCSTNIRPEDCYSEVIPPTFDIGPILDNFGPQVEEYFVGSPRNVQVFAATDELYRRALSYSQIPYRGIVSPKVSYLLALQSAATSSCTGWFREFVWENFDLLVAMYDEGYAPKFWAEVEAGNIKPV